MAAAEQTFATEIDGAIEHCVAVLLDFDEYPRWSGPIVSARVLERDAEGRGRDVEFSLDMKLKTVRYVLQYSYALPSRATWHMIDGDVSGIEGSYQFEPLGKDRARATCTQSVDLGFWIPGPLRRIFERQALRDSVLEFKAEVERRARS